MPQALTPREKVNFLLDSWGETDQTSRDEILLACRDGYTNPVDGIFYSGKDVREYFVGIYGEKV